MSVNTHHISFSKLRKNHFTPEEDYTGTGYLQIRQHWYRLGSESMPSCFPLARGNLSQHATKPMIALLEAGLAGHMAEPRFLEFHVVISCPFLKSTKCKCRGDSLLFVIAFQQEYLLHATSTLGAGGIQKQIR